ncbi:MAG: lipoate protein ligase C-terminal domain-containing protein [Candidatus Aenigmatarchaeota archaeon]
MKRHIDYKVPGGKFLRIDIDTEKDKITDIRITGDFFIHPEEGILDIENSLRGANKNKVGEILRKTLNEKNIKIIGFDVSDIEKAVSMAFVS